MSSGHRMRLLGRSDQGGRPDGVQVMVAKGHAYVGHMFSDGIAVIDVRDPRAPKAVNFVACPENTRASHIQVHDGLLLAVNAANVWALQKYEKQTDYFGKSLADSFDRDARGFAAGMRVYDLANPAAPRESVLSLLDWRENWLRPGRASLPVTPHHLETRALAWPWTSWRPRAWAR